MIQHTVLKSCRSKIAVIYVIIKTMCRSGYHYNGSVVTHALCVNRTSCVQVYELWQSHCGDNWECKLFLRSHTHIHIHTHTHTHTHIYI